MYPNSNPPYPPYNQAPGYPPQQNPPYPTQPGYPGAAPPYPPQGQYPPPTGFQIPTPGYPPQPQQQPYGTPSYPPTPYGAQPPPQTSPYPTQQAYPPQQQQAYPPAGAGYPPQQSAYPPQQSAYPPSTYPNIQQQQPAYSGVGVTQSSYPAQQFGAGAGYPHQQGPTNMSFQQYQEVPGIPYVNCDPQADAAVLRKAMKGFGTDERAIIQVLTRRTDAQRQQICTAFKASYGKDLIKDLKNELGGKLEDVIVALMTPRIDYLAQTVRKAISGLGTKESVLVDTLCTATNNEIRQISAAYHRLFGTTLERDLKGDTSGHFLRLLVSICTASRSEDPNVNQAMAADDAKKLHSAGEGKWGTDESVFNMILATRSWPHLRTVFHEYERLTGHAFERAVQREFSGDVEIGMLAIVKCAKNRAQYYAERLHQSLAGLGTKDNDLIFIMVSRADIDLGSIANEYQKMYNKALAKDISGDTSGDYKKVLLGLLGA